jgi:hypothetical protein
MKALTTCQSKPVIHIPAVLDVLENPPATEGKNCAKALVLVKVLMMQIKIRR